MTHRMVSSEKYSYEEILNMHPYERDIFIHFLVEDAKKQEEEMKKSQNNYKHKFK